MSTIDDARNRLRAEFLETGESEDALEKALALIGESATGRTAKDRQ